MLHGRRNRRASSLGLGAALFAGCFLARDASSRSDVWTPRLRDVPVGNWSEYLSVSGDLRFRIVIALVARGRKSQVIETTVQDGSVPNAPVVVTRTVLGLDAAFGDKPIGGAIQGGDKLPITLPPPPTGPPPPPRTPGPPLTTNNRRRQIL